MTRCSLAGRAKSGVKRSKPVNLIRAAPSEPLPGPKPEFFFVPTYAAERLKSDPQLGQLHQELRGRMRDLSGLLQDLQSLFGLAPLDMECRKVVVANQERGRSLDGILVRSDSLICASETHEDGA